MTVSEILKAITELDDNQLDLLGVALGHGMFDEWDCSLELAIDQFGPAEWRVAAKTAAGFAAYQEKHQHD